jgi:hypothetical protein
MKKIYEFLLWDNCNNNCKFCWQRKNPRIYAHEERIQILSKVLEFIRSDKFEKGSHILVCGGEIFDKPSDFNTLSAFFFAIIQFMKQGIVDLLYLNTNLIYLNINGLYDTLEQLKEADLLNRVHFTTSYDVVGRFKDKRDEQIMLTNLQTISKKYSQLPIITNIVLTEPTCKAILENQLNVKEFMNQYRCWVNLLPYIVFDNTLTAERKLIFKTLEYVNAQCEGYLEKYVPNMCIKQEKWLYMFKDGTFQFCSCDISPECGHAINFKKYSKEGTCFCCDLENIFGEYV